MRQMTSRETELVERLIALTRANGVRWTGDFKEEIIGSVNLELAENLPRVSIRTWERDDTHEDCYELCLFDDNGLVVFSEVEHPSVDLLFREAVSQIEGRHEMYAALLAHLSNIPYAACG